MNVQYRTRRNPYGFVFLNPEQTKVLQDKSRSAQKELLNAGFERVIPATLDYAETFGIIDSNFSFRMRDRLGSDLALRNDVTVQVIKGFANQLELDLNSEHRFYYAVPVYRDFPRSFPTHREVFQLGCEIINVHSEFAIFELLPLALKIFSLVIKEKVKIILGDVQIVAELSKLNPDPLQDIVNQRNVPGLQDWFVAAGYKEDSLAQSLLFPCYDGEWVETMAASSLPEEFKKSILFLWNKLGKIIQKLPDRSSVRLAPLIQRKANYYTSYVFEGYLDKGAQPPLRGGVYDNLVENFSFHKASAAGFAIDLSLTLL